MQIELPELAASATLILGDEDRLNDDQYFSFCAANPELIVERTSGGEIVLEPPPGWEADYCNVEVIGFLREWAKKDGRGKASGSSVQFILPDGSTLGPDAAWVSKARLGTLTRQELRKFPHLVPEFIIEILSPSDRLAAAKKKMRQWMANGVELGWLIDGDNRTVYVFLGAEEPRVIENARSIAGEGPVEGFVLPLSEIWEGL